MSQKILFKNKKIVLSPKAIKGYSTTLLKKLKAMCNKESEYLSQFDGGLDKHCANVWKHTSETIDKELKRRMCINH